MIDDPFGSCLRARNEGGFGALEPSLPSWADLLDGHWRDTIVGATELVALATGVVRVRAGAPVLLHGLDELADLSAAGDVLVGGHGTAKAHLGLEHGGAGGLGEERVRDLELRDLRVERTLAHCRSINLLSQELGGFRGECCAGHR